MNTISEGRRISYRGCATSLVALFTFGLGVSATAQDHKATIISFDAPGAGTENREGTFGISINPKGAIARIYLDSNDVYHGFVRASDGAFTTFDPPGVGTGSFQGTQPFAINPSDVITGYYVDANNVPHGFVRASDGTIASFDAPGAGQGTQPGCVATMAGGGW
jgi:hypothetical protein